MKDLNLKKIFWDDKILNWEKEKYYAKNMFFDVNSSVKYRMKLTNKILSKISKNKVLLEIGCGSGLLIDELSKIGIKKYIGVDISSKAIKEAKLKAKLIENIEFEFINADISQIKNLKVDICFSIGFIDWITIENIKLMNRKIKSNFFFHSFSEKKISMSQFCHRLFVFLKYGYKSNGYQPNYYEAKQILDCFIHSKNSTKFFRDNKLSFGTFIYNLPFNLNEEFIND